MTLTWQSNVVSPVISRRLRTPWSIFVDERTARGPVAYLDVLHDAAALVPPGRAYRRGVELLDAARSSQGLPVRKGDVDEAIRRGQRHIASTSIRQMERNGRIEVYDDDGGVKMVRRTTRR
jgi:hypothetical protein